MLEEQVFTFSSVNGGDLALLGAIAFLAAIVSGMSGIGGSILVSIFAAPVIGVKALVPTLAIAALLAHVTRVWVYRREVQWSHVALIVAAAVPTAVVGSALYVHLSSEFIGILIGLFLLASVPARRLAHRRSFRLEGRGLVLAAGSYGFVSGTTIGGGILIIPVLMAAGLLGPHLVATDAVIGLAVLVAKTSTFTGFDLLTGDLALAGLLIGACMIPGTYVARWLILRTQVHIHTLVMDAVVIVGGLSFFWRAIQGV